MTPDHASLVERVADSIYSRFDNCPGTEYSECQELARAAIRVVVECAAAECDKYHGSAAKAVRALAPKETK